jgi:hypothetical protein
MEMRLIPFFFSFLFHSFVGVAALAVVVSPKRAPVATDIEVIPSAKNHFTFQPPKKSILFKTSQEKRIASPPLETPALPNQENLASADSAPKEEHTSGAEVVAPSSVLQKETFFPGDSSHPYFKKVWKRLFLANHGIKYKINLDTQYKIRITLDKDGKISMSDVHGDVDQIADELRRRIKQMAFLPPIPDEISHSQIVLQYEVTLTSNRL